MSVDLLIGIVLGLAIMVGRHRAKDQAHRDEIQRCTDWTVEALNEKNREIAALLRRIRDSDAADQLIEETRNAK